MLSRNRPTFPHRTCRRGFTLIELVVVTTILALAAAAVIVIFHPLVAKSQYEDFISRLKEVDDLTRRTSHINAKDLTIEFDLSTQTISYSRWNEGIEYQTKVKVPRGIKLGEIIGGLTDSGTRVVIPIRSGGYSNNYAIRIDSNGNQKWLLFFGGSGEVQEVENEDEIKSRFSAL